MAITDLEVMAGVELDTGAIVGAPRTLESSSSALLAWANATAMYGIILAVKQGNSRAMAKEKARGEKYSSKVSSRSSEIIFYKT